MEEVSNKNDKKHPNIPSNYVTLLQLQERWIKEQQRKQKENEEVAAKQNEESDQKVQEAQPIRTNPIWKHHRKNRNSKLTGAKETNAVAASIVEENENENESGAITNKEMKREELTKKENKKKEKKEKEEEGEKEREDTPQSPLVVTATRNKKKSQPQMEFRPKINDAGEMGVRTVVKEIDQKIGDLSIEKGKNRLSFQRQNRGYRGYNTVVSGGNWGRRGGNWRFSRGDGHGSRGYRRFNGSGERKGTHDGMVWVRKEVAAGGGDIAASARSSKEL